MGVLGFRVIWFRGLGFRVFACIGLGVIGLLKSRFRVYVGFRVSGLGVGGVARLVYRSLRRPRIQTQRCWT